MKARITSIDWQTYPILRFDAVPELRRLCISSTGPASRSSAAAKPVQGPAAASIANAIADATGKRLRDLPLTRKRIKDAIDT